jgi:hypothetical protein
VCGYEEKIVETVARSGSRNHKLLLLLMSRGATLLGTESPELLVQEYESIRKVATAADPAIANHLAETQGEELRRLLEQRDLFIADRIDGTLSPGATGLIFLGMVHSLIGLLAPDIEVHDPFGLLTELEKARQE